MNRLVRFVAISQALRDRQAFLLLATISAIAVWLLALPVSPWVQRATIDRFHLTSGSFAAWAVQQPIPPMYNLENRYWYSPRALAASELTIPPPLGVQTGMLNHFPARMITCASGRLLVMENTRDSWFYLQSKYQGSQKITVYRLVASESGALKMELVQEQP